jgi:hypothetical protein
MLFGKKQTHEVHTRLNGNVRQRVENSGLSKKAFCCDWDIPYQTFDYWCKRVETFQRIKEEYPKVTPKSPIGKARAYSLKRGKELTLFLSDGRLEIDNNKI